MKPRKSLDNEVKKQLQYLEIRGERITYYIRWFVLFLQLFFVAPFYYRTNHINIVKNPYFIGIISATVIYNLILTFILKWGKYRGYIKYISLANDMLILSLGIYVWSHLFSTLFQVTTMSLYLYSLVVALASSRMDMKFTLISLLSSAVVFNLQFILWISTFKAYPEFIFAATNGFIYQQQVLKTIYLLIFGGALCYTNYLIKKFVVDKIITYRRAVNAETRVVNQFKTILNNINTGISIADERGTIIFINKTLVNLLGYRKKDLIGRNISEIIDKNRNFLDSFKRAIEKKRYLNFEIVMKKKNGVDTPVRVYVTKTLIIRDNTYLITLIDLTKQKALEERLLQSRKMEIIGRLANGFAHDFNNLISILEQNLYYAMLESVDTKSLIEKIKVVIDRQKELVELLYRISGKIEKESTELSISSIFTKIIKLLHHTIPQSIKLEIKSEIPDNYIFITNETAIMQVLVNLITNAKEAIEPGEGTITVHAYTSTNFDFRNAILTPKKTKNQDFLILEVVDNGPGIPKKLLKSIFEPYVSTKKQKESFKRGLGLSFVYAIIEQLNGGIAVKTEKGKGTTFTISIPVRIVLKSEGIKPPSFTSEKNEPEFNVGENTPCILYIDDDEDMRLITAKILKKYGYTVYSVERGKHALDLIKNHKNYDLIMTDYYLPDIEGKELIKRIKEHINVPIILMTGSQEESIERLNSDNTVAAIVKKPIEVEKLLEAVEKTITNIPSSTG